MSGIRSLLLALRERLDDLRRRRPRDPKALGRAGERHAARWARRQGYRIAGRNIHGRGRSAGEADLIAIAPDRRTIVIFEVKTRERDADAPNPRDLPPEAALNHHKRQTLRALARELAREHRWGKRPIQIDALAIEFIVRADRVVDHIVRHYQRIA
jgi:Holliday junction resolvase-like predicted endonuclease